MTEGLQSFLQDLAYMQSLPDADIGFLRTLQDTVLNKIREPMDLYQQMTQQATAGGGAPPMGMGGPGAAPPPGGGAPPGLAAMLGGGGGLPPGMGAGSPVPQGGQVPGNMMNGVAMPPVDELRRLLQTGS